MLTPFYPAIYNYYTAEKLQSPAHRCRVGTTCAVAYYAKISPSGLIPTLAI
jgi:hypothetical protein